MDRHPAVEQHSVVTSLVLHLLPGLLIGLCYWALLQPVRRWGYPSIMALMIALALVLVPVEAGYLLYQGYRKHGRLSLRGVVAYRTPIPIWQYLIWVPVVFVAAGIVFTVMKPVDAFFQRTLFGWLPALESGLEGGYSRGVLIATYAMVAIFGALLGPVVEEFYFRGYLLPRMNYAGKWAPVLHSFLFALYHVFTPWLIVTRTLALLPLVLVVQRRNLTIGIIVHVLLNMLDVVAGVSYIIAMVMS